MRKMLATFLVCLHLLGNTEASQLLKLPQLLHHYFQHHRQDNSIGFFEFLAMHYGGDDGTDADNDFDNQLPCHNSGQNTMIIVYSPMVSEIPVFTAPVADAHAYNSRLQTGQGSKHVLLVIQPPRIS